MKIIITGTTGMVGEGILMECLNLPIVEEILSVSRKPCGINHPKLKEYIVPNFLDLDLNDVTLKNFDSCFYCAGVSSVGMSEEIYKQITYDTTLHFAKALNPNPNLTFIYVSGSGTDSTEKGRMSWARIKGKTENDLMKLPFKQAFGFRIGFLIANPEQKNVLKLYKYVNWLIPLIKFFLPNLISTIKQVALAMLNVSINGYNKNIIEVKDIALLSKNFNNKI